MQWPRNHKQRMVVDAPWLEKQLLSKHEPQLSFPQALPLLQALAQSVSSRIDAFDKVCNARLSEPEQR